MFTTQAELGHIGPWDTLGLGTHRAMDTLGHGCIGPWTHQTLDTSGLGHIWSWDTLGLGHIGPWTHQAVDTAGWPHNNVPFGGGGAHFMWDSFSMCGMGRSGVWGPGEGHAEGEGRSGLPKKCLGMIWHTPKKPWADTAWEHLKQFSWAFLSTEMSS